jgi:hypothetical protein
VRLAAWVLAAVAAVAGLSLLLARYGIPNLVGSGQAFAGEHAVSLLRTVHWAQGLYREQRYTDADRDGVGEFGTLAQLAGVAPADAGSPIPAALVQIPEAEVLPSGVLSAMGYCFRVDLPDGADPRERRFSALAWPAAQGVVGPQLYCVDQDEQLLEREARAFVGCDRGPPAGFCPDAAHLPEGWARWRNKTSVKPVGAK